MQTIFSSILTFALGLFFTFFGLMFLLVIWEPLIRSGVFHLFTHYEVLLSIFGGGFLFIGISIIIYALIFSRRRYFYIRTGSREVQISEDVAKDYVNKYFQKLFGQKDLPCTLNVRRGKIHISANLPFIPEQEQQSLTQKINSEISDLLYYRLGYDSLYYLSLSFEGKPQEPKPLKI